MFQISAYLHHLRPVRLLFWSQAGMWISLSWYAHLRNSLQWSEAAHRPPRLKRGLLPETCLCELL